MTLPRTRLVFIALTGSLFLVASTALAFEGRLVDRRSAKPIAGAEIFIAGVSGSTHTRDDGRFTWTNDPPVPFQILIVLPGGQLAPPVRVRALGEAPLLVHVDGMFNEDVFVTGSAPSIDAPPGAAATVIASADLERRMPANLTQALEDVPGVSSVAEGQSAVPAVRGLARGRTLVLVDGFRVFSERRAGPSVSFLAPETMDRIDVVRGPASVAYGSDAFGGVISVLSRRPPSQDPFSARVSAAAGAGVPARRWDAEVSTSLGARTFLLAEGRHRDTDNYSSPDGEVTNSAWSDSGGLVRVLARAAGGWWSGGWQGDFVGPSGRPRSDAITMLTSSPFERSQRGSMTFDRSGPGRVASISISGLVGTYAQRIDQDRLPAPNRARHIDRGDIEGTDIQLRAIAHMPIRSARLMVGTDYNKRLGLEAHDIGINYNLAGAITSTTDNVSIADARKNDSGLFAELALPLARAVTITGGARVDAVRSDNIGGFYGDRTVTNHAGSGSIAITTRPFARLIITGLASRGFHDPTLSDRFYRGPVGRGFIVGNPDLNAEHSQQFDLTTRYAASRWQASASYYRYDISSLIERYQSGADTFLFRNRGLARLQGVEVEARTAIRGVVVRVTAQSSNGRAIDDNTSLDDVAPRAVAVQVHRNFGLRVIASARIAAIARDSRPGPTEVATPGYADVGAAASWRIGRALELRTAAANLLNEHYYSSPSVRWVYAPGRNVTIAAAVKF